MNETPGGTDRELEKRYRAAVLFYIVEIAAVAVMAIFAWALLGRQEQTKPQFDLTPLWILIVFIAAGSLVLRRMLFRWDRFRDRKLLSGQAGLLKSLQINAFILGAVGGMIGLFGLIASMISGDRYDMVRVAVVAFIILAMNFPRHSVWAKVSESLNDL